jgi:2-iminobutanoate/2-iminopropanoate deaminase
MVQLSKKTVSIISIISVVLIAFLALGMFANFDKGAKRKVIHTEKAPKAIGPYSQAILFGETLYISGQLGIKPVTNNLPESIEDQTKQAMLNLKAILDEANMDFRDVVQTHIFLKDIKDFQKVNEIYATYFEGDFPARATMQVAALPKDGKIEIEMVACKAAKK